MSNKKKILIIADALDNQRAGVHTYVYHLIEQLSKDKNHKYVLIREKSASNIGNITTYSRKHHWIPRYLWQIYKTFFAVPYIARRQKVDVVIETAHFGPWFLSKKILRITIIHDLTPLLASQFHTHRMSIPQKFFLPHILRKTDRIISNSSSTTSDIRKVIGPREHAKIATLKLGYDPYFTYDRGTEALKKYNIDKKYFLCVGTLEPRKDYATIIEAFEKYKGVMDDTTMLVIVGGYGWKYHNIIKKVATSKHQGDILLTGYIKKDELRQLYSHAALSIYASVYEGFGLPILESLACETRCIVADNSSLKEVGGNVCQFFQTGSPDSLYERLLQFSDTPLNESDKKNIHRHLTQFSWGKYAKDLLSLIEASHI